MHRLAVGLSYSILRGVKPALSAQPVAQLQLAQLIIGAPANSRRNLTPRDENQHSAGDEPNPKYRKFADPFYGHFIIPRFEPRSLPRFSMDHSIEAWLSDKAMERAPGQIVSGYAGHNMAAYDRPPAEYLLPESRQQ